MFSWATSQFEKLSMAVAPPPTDPVSRFILVLQKQSEDEALQCVMESPDILHVVVHPTKGSYAIHMACQHSMARLVHYILTQPGCHPHVTDAQGNTALHYAALSSQRTDNQAVNVCRMLVTDFGASVITKNALGQTAYEVATLTSVRQYLLPLQLQQETQQALDNGGVGLPPGIDLGGHRIQNNNMMTAPPPLIPPPPTNFGSPPPYANMTNTNTATPTAAAATAGGGPPQHNMFSTPSPMNPTNHTQGNYATIAPAPATMPAPMVHHARHQPPPTSQGSVVVPADESSSSYTTTNPRQYARSGSSSAALDSISTTRRSKSFVRADGFHSSSSDVNLQKKYGHDVSINTKAVPPPPTSGNNAIIMPMMSGNKLQHASSEGGAAVNPYSAGGAVLSGGVHRYASGSALPHHPSRRYVVYDAVTRTTMAPHSAPLAAAAAAAGANATLSIPTFSVFTPSAITPTTSSSASNNSWSQQQQQQNFAPAASTTAAAAWQPEPTQPYYQQPAAAPLSGSGGQPPWQQQQQQQQQSWQRGYSQPNTVGMTTAPSSTTWQSNPNLYEESAPATVGPQQQQAWQVGYDYGGASQQQVSAPTYASQDIPTVDAPPQHVEQQQQLPPPPVAAEAFFAPPPQDTTTTMPTTQSWGAYNNAAPTEAEPVTDAPLEFQEGAVRQTGDASNESTPLDGAAPYATEPTTQTAVATSAASTLSSNLGESVNDSLGGESSWSSSTPFSASQPPRPQPVSLIGTFDAEVKTVSSSNVAEDFFSAPPGRESVTSGTAASYTPAPTVVIPQQQQPIARAPGSWGIPPAMAMSLAGGPIAAGDFFSNLPAQQQHEQTSSMGPLPATAPPAEEIPTTTPVAAETVSTQATVQSFPPTSASVQVTVATANPVVMATTGQGTPFGVFAISNCGPFSEPNVNVPLSAAALFSTHGTDGTSSATTSLFDRPPTAATTAPHDAASLFSQFPRRETNQNTAANLLDGQAVSSSQSKATDHPLDSAATLFSQGSGQQKQQQIHSFEATAATASHFDQPPPRFNAALGLSGLGAAEAFDATTGVTATPEIFANGSMPQTPDNTPPAAASTPADGITEQDGEDSSSNTMHNSVLNDDELFDVALSPSSSARKSFAIETENSIEATSEPSSTDTTTNVPPLKATESLFAAIGLPPPPFSSSRR